MKCTTLDLLACPSCNGPLEYAGDDEKNLHTGILTCFRCKQRFPLVDGIPHFIQPETLSGFNRRFARMYNWLSWGYRLFSKVAFAYIGMDEETARRQVTDRLDPQGGRVLEVSVGPGVNLPYLLHRLDVSEVVGLDISLGQLQRCQSYLAKKGWDVDLLLGNGEQLPVRDETFGGVFHIGGINFFSDKKSAIEEMIRVAKPGARILISDETEKGAQAYERFIPGFKKSVGGKRKEIVPPMDLVPANMLERRVVDVWKGWLYCVEFRKP